MTREEIIASAVRFVEVSPGNYVSEEVALDPSFVGMQIFESPIFAFGAANDMLYNEYKEEGVIGSPFMTPVEWFPGVKTVISFFLPFTDKVKEANAKCNDWPADEWLQARHEGQLFLQDLTFHIQELLYNAGYESLIPSLDPRFEVFNRSIPNWSERHAAFACGLGTFGLSKGLITKKGICGRFGSLLTDLSLDTDKSSYTEIYDYCNMCGVCIKKCPSKAISKDGKDSSLCAAFLSKVREKHDPRYGCGKCQVDVPCESRIPANL